MQRCCETAPRELGKAVEEFNSGDWFQCHETLEELWVGEKGELRDFYQGLLQIAVALYHWRNGNYQGAVGLLRRGGACLQRVSPRCQGVEVARVVADAAAMEKALETLGAERMAELEPRLVPLLHRVKCSGAETR